MKQNIWGKNLSLLILPALVVLAILVIFPSKALAVTNGKIAYCSDEAGDSNVFTMDADGSNKTQITDDDSSCYPSIAPDGSRILYWVLGGETPGTGVVNTDGTSNSIILPTGGYSSWLPNSSRILFADFSSGFEFKTANYDGTSQLPLDWVPGLEGYYATLRFSPDSSMITYGNPNGVDTSVYIADSTGSSPAVLSSIPFAVMPNFSADGQKIYFVGSTDGETFSLYSVNVDGSNETEVQSLPATGNPSLLLISPDGTKLVYGTIDNDDSTKDIYTMNIDGSNQVKIVNDLNFDAVSFGWSPDSTKLVFPNSDGSQSDIFTINADGTGLTNLTNTSENTELFAYTFQAWGAATDSSSPGGSDSDNDGISDTVENNGPNGGDANNDGIQDSEQAYVSSFVDSVTGEYAVLAVSEECSISSISVAKESANSKADADFSYPMGLMDFTLDCGTAGFTADVSQYYYEEDSSDFILRKYNPTTKTYTTIDGASISNQTIASKNVVVAAYQVKDGGSLDLDGATDGNISDPSGLATQTESLADTGQNTTTITLLATVLLTSGLALGLYSYNEKILRGRER